MTVKALNYIFELPENLPSNEIQVHFESLITEYQSSCKLDYFEALVELADKQWHNYERLEENFQRKFEDWLISVLDLSCLEVVEYALRLTATLGLRNVFNFFVDLSTKKGIVSREVHMEISSAIKELEISIDDRWL
jgi:type I site-specific restriction-modification system R (restriction) subunit